ncbi:hypothetical protein Q3G72_006683 [Acer saccharum]|nr:hypothetical protein Q3G72_006683 [Acer saccharum]
MVLPDGTSLDNMEMVHNGAINYFEHFLGTSVVVHGADLENFIQPSISEVIVNQLKVESTEEEVYDVLKSISVDSCPGLDGFGSSFYITCWKIIKNDVMVKNPHYFDKFRPISLCNVIYKAFSKILVHKLSLVIGDLISSEQGAFVKGRSIFENVPLTQEMTKMLHRKVRRGNVILKIDMSKAYDCVEWKFVNQTLHVFGFPDFYCKLIQNCISTPWFSVMMNGTYKGFFKSEKGLRQGDPLSPYLFILMEEVLSRMIYIEMFEKRILPFSHPCDAPIISHMLYADDVVFFVIASKKYVRGLMRVLKKYESWTRQRVNQEKSAIFSSKNLCLRRKNEILYDMGFTEGKFPFTYFGSSDSGWLKDLVLDNVWDVEELQRLLGLEKADKVMGRVGKFRNSKDVLLWIPEKNGCFSSKSALDVVRKAAFNCLSVDEKVRSVGIPIVSACNCCSIRGIEDLDHILNKGDFASNLWRKVSAEVGVPFLAHLSWKERVQQWFNRAGRSSQLENLMGLIPCLVIWRLWRRRCAARIEGKLESISDVWLSIKHYVQVLSNSLKKVRHWNSSDDRVLRNMEVQILLKKQKKIHVLRWLKSGLGRLKLNLDGSSLGNPGPAGGGGIFHDSAGNFIFGFSKFFGSCSNNEAEL